MNKIINKSEPYFFLLVILLNLSPILTSMYFCTLDGGAHAYNSNILKTLLTNSHSIYSDIFAINSEPVPNWSGHLFLALLALFFKSYVSEKILVCSILILIPFFFRKIVKLIAPSNIVLSYLIFPFTHYILLYLGFYNFTLGILFFFITVYFYFKNNDNFRWHHYITLTFLFGALYFSHLFVFAVTVFCLGIHTLSYALFNSENNFWFRIRKKAAPVLLSSMPFLILTINYFVKRPIKPVNEIAYLSSEQIWIKILDGQIFSIDMAGDKPFASLFFFVLTILCLFVIIKGIILFFNNRNKKQMISLFFYKPISSFLILIIFLFSMAFVFPDSDGYGGFIISRFIYLAVIFMLLFSLDLSYSGKNFNILLLFIVGFSYSNLVNAKKNLISAYSRERHKFDVVFEKIPDNSTILNIKLIKNNSWILAHFMDYAGADKKILILNGNYEAEQKYFPIVYKNDQSIKYSAGEYSLFFGQNKVVNNDTIKRNIDYVLIYGFKNGDSEYPQILNKIGDKYELMYASPSVNMFKRKK